MQGKEPNLDSNSVEAQAADWLARRDGSAWTNADEAEFLAWQEENTLHRVAVLRLKAAWAHADRLQVVRAGLAQQAENSAEGEWLLLPRFEQPRRRLNPGASSDDRRSVVRSPLAWGIAASLVIAVASMAVWRLVGSQTTTYGTRTGGMEVVTLADGSRVTLNTDSAVRVTLGKSERRMVLERGEAYFEAAKDLRRPFVVQAADERVVALGTSFSVMRERQEVRIVVTEGRVRVAGTELSAGSVARAGVNGIAVTRGSAEEAQSYLSWRSGYIYLDDTALSDAVREFNRYNAKPIVIGDPSLASLRLGGNFRATNPTAFVRVLEHNFPVTANDAGDRIVLVAGSKH